MPLDANVHLRKGDVVALHATITHDPAISGADWLYVKFLDGSLLTIERKWIDSLVRRDFGQGDVVKVKSGAYSYEGVVRACVDGFAMVMPFGKDVPVVVDTQFIDLAPLPEGEPATVAVEFEPPLGGRVGSSISEDPPASDPDSAMEF